MASDPPVPPLAALDAAKSRDDIARLVLDYTAELTPRCALLVVRGGALLVLDGRGLAASLGEMARVSLPLSPPSTLSLAIESGSPHRGALGESVVDRGWSDRLGGVPAEILLLPIVVRGRPIALLYADGWSGLLADVPLYATASAAGRAYERLILERKQGTAGRARTTAPRPLEVPPPIAPGATSAPPSLPRADPRYAVALDCLVRHAGHAYEGESRDLSRGGLCVRLARAIPVGARVDLQISLVFEENAQSEALTLPATIVWSTRLGDGFQVGTKFVELDDEMRRDVDLFLRFLEARPEEDEQEDDADNAPWA